VTYADTSALVKLLIAEGGSNELVGYLRETPGPLTSSQLTIAELSRIMQRAVGDAAAAHMLLETLDLLAVDEALLWRAGRLPSPPGTFLRTADAVHLVTAMELGESAILTYDRRQAQAAAEHGFRVITPGLPDNWHA
jgi:predicted nucleic acid-binding protein